MKRIKFYAPWVANVALLTEISVFACKCVEQSSPSVAFAQAHEVFAGTVIDIALLEPAVPADPGDATVGQIEEQFLFTFLRKRVTFQVIETWKGSNTITKVVLTGLGYGDCGYPLMQGSNYLVYTYATGSPEYPGAVDICSRTKAYSSAETDLKFLGSGEKPLHPVLNILREQSKTILTWQTNWTNFRLEAARSFQSPVIWQPVSNEAGILGRNYVVTNETAMPGLFFRLTR